MPSDKVAIGWIPADVSAKVGDGRIATPPSAAACCSADRRSKLGLLLRALHEERQRNNRKILVQLIFTFKLSIGGIYMLNDLQISNGRCLEERE